MGNQHTGAALLKGGLLQRYQLQARVCGSVAETEPGPGLLKAAPAASAARSGPHRSFVRCRRRGAAQKRRQRGSSPSLLADIYIKRCPALQVRGCAGASVGFHGQVMREAGLLPRLLYPRSGGFDLCACFSCCLLGLSSAALGQSVPSQRNLQIISCWQSRSLLSVGSHGLSCGSVRVLPALPLAQRVLGTRFICLLLLGTVADQN